MGKLQYKHEIASDRNVLEQLDSNKVDYEYSKVSETDCGIVIANLKNLNSEENQMNIDVYTNSKLPT